MPSGSIPHGTQRPDSGKRHENGAFNSPELPDESYEGAMAAQNAPYMGVIPGRAITDRRLSAFQYRVFTLMCGYANTQTRICWPKQETLARLLDTNVQVISKIIAQLIKLGYVEVNRYGFPARNVYRIIWETPQETSRSPRVVSPDKSELSPQTSQSCLPRQVNNRPIEQTSKSLRILRDLHDGEEETRVNARAALTEKIVSAGDLPRQTNRAALAQLVANHPQISEGEWEFQAAAAAEWFADHGRRLTLASFASWITRYLRERQQLTSVASPEQEQSHGRSSQHRGSHGARNGAGRSPAQSSRVSADLRYPAGPDDAIDDTIPDGANEEDLVEQYRLANSERRRAEEAERQARLN